MIKNLDYSLFLVIFFLSAISLAIIFDIAPHDFLKQALFILIGFSIALLVSQFNYHYLKSISFSLYLLMLFILGAVLILGQEIRGTKSWFGWGDWGFQPVELAKLVVIIILAKYFAKNYRQILLFRHLIISFLFILLPIILILLQPDLGSVIVLSLIWLIMLIIAGLRWRYFIGLSILSILLSLISWLWFLKDYQKDRLRIFLNPQLDPLDQGYNIIQSIIAIGSGGLLGKGLGYGLQSQLNFLPEKHTDFIFAVIAEELGLVGVLLVLGFYAFIFWRAYLIIKSAPDNFGKFLGVGVTVFFLTHLFINIGMNIGLLPVIGIPLLFLSYGGSSILVSFVALGILQSIKRHSRVLT